LEKIKTFSLSRHSRLFSVEDLNREYLFVSAIRHPHLEEPYRAESYAIAYLRKGEIQLQAGLVSHHVQSPAIITLAPLMIRSFSKSSERIELDIIFFKESFLLEKHADLFFLLKQDFFENSELTVLMQNVAVMEKIDHIFKLISLTHHSANYHANNIIRNYIFVLIYEIDATYRQMQVTTPAYSLNPLTAKFLQVLKSNYLRERKLEFYADKLSVTTKYLSAAVTKHTGKSAGAWISEMITLEVKVLLQNSSLTVSQISNQLNFGDQSVFGKFFKSHTGMSPMEYRRSL
jgi:AraC-like DNA-binding protein